MWMLHTVHVMYMNVHIDWHAAKSNFEVGPYRTRFPREFALLHCHMWYDVPRILGMQGT